MSNSVLKDNLNALAKEVCTAKRGGEYARFQMICPDVRAFGSAESLLHFMRHNRLDSEYPRKERILRSFLFELHVCPRAFYREVVFVMFAPMLWNLRNHTMSPKVHVHDLEQEITCAFLNLINGFPLGVYKYNTFFTIKSFLYHHMVAWKNREIANFDELSKDGDLLVRIARERVRGTLVDCSGSAHEKTTPAELIDFFVEVTDELKGDKRVTEEAVTLVRETAVRKENLLRYVERRYPGLTDRERIRTYERLKRMRSRVIARMKPILERMASPGRKAGMTEEDARKTMGWE